MPRIICTCARCRGKYIISRSFNGPDAARRREEWEAWVKKTPGLCNDCKLTLESRRAERASAEKRQEEEEGLRKLEEDFAALELPTIVGRTQAVIVQAERLRKNFFHNRDNMRLLKLLERAPDIYNSCPWEKQLQMAAAAERAGWGEDFAGAFAVANANLPSEFYQDILGRRYAGGQRGYIGVLRRLLEEENAATIVDLLRPEDD